MRGLGPGLGLSLGAVRLLQIFSAVNAGFLTWSVNGTTVGVGSTANPEDGAFGVDLRETATTGNHGAGSLIPFTAGNYRIRILVNGTNETIIALFTSVDSSTKFLYYDFSTGTNISSSGFFNITRTPLGSGWFVITVDMSVAVPGGSPDLNISIAKPGPAPSFTGAITDGLVLGSCRVYRITT